MVNLVLLLKLHPIRILLYVLPRWLSSLVFHRQECGSTKRAPQALCVVTSSDVAGSGVSEAVGLWLELTLWQTGIERLFQKEEVDLFQLMLKALFLGLDLLHKKTFFREAVRYYLAIFSSIKGVSLRGTWQSF